MHFSTKTPLAVLPYFIQVQALASGTGTTTRYWDCCKPSCAWSGKTTLAARSSPVTTCDINDSPLSDPNAVSGCNGGTAYQCSTESPWAVSDTLSYGYAAVNIAGGSEDSWCCACYELTFASGAIAGKKMVVQATNTGGDLAGNQFDISIPGGGVGIFNGCTAEFSTPSTGWAPNTAGCDNPTVEFKQVACPAAITKNSNCIRADDSSAPAADAPAASSPSSPATSTSTAIIASSSSVIASSSAEAAEVAQSSSTSTAAAIVASSFVVEVVSSSTSAIQEVASSSSVEMESSTAAAAVATSTSSASSAVETGSEGEGGDEDEDDKCEL